ncbi:MAG: YdbL family protein [Proteobacteria bacterium]|nr:YdbL family protein [Pseudomonadota bacterium]
MKKILRPIWLAMLGAMILTFACVTINIYFPAEKVESVAGEIVNDIRGGNQDKPPKSDKTSFIGKTLLALLPSPAWAQDATTVSNPTIRALKERLKNNYMQMKPYYDKGMVKEGDDGYVSLGNTGGLGLKEVRDLKALADAENQYRRQLYEEVAKALKIDLSQINKVAEIFAKEWQKSVR